MNIPYPETVHGTWDDDFIEREALTEGEGILMKRLCWYGCGVWWWEHGGDVWFTVRLHGIGGSFLMGENGTE